MVQEWGYIPLHIFHIVEKYCVFFYISKSEVGRCQKHSFLYFLKTPQCHKIMCFYRKITIFFANVWKSHRNKHIWFNSHTVVQTWLKTHAVTGNISKNMKKQNTYECAENCNFFSFVCTSTRFFILFCRFWPKKRILFYN